MTLSRSRLIFEKQWLHAAAIAVLLAGMTRVATHDGVRAGQLWGVATPVWLWTSVGVAIAHQVYVWLCWRTQLHASLLTRSLGSLAFPLYAVGFSALGIARGLVFVVAMSNRNTLPGNAALLKSLAVVALIPAAYLFYSVRRYFGFKRAMGVDHFESDYRSLPLERRGIFRFTRNGMYVYGFLLLWFPALWWSSLAALSVAVFSHLYIWVHYFATELPDMRRIYGNKAAKS